MIRHGRELESVMWKSILFRRPLRRDKDEKTDNPPSPAAMSAQANPFADLMAQLDKIPYQRRWKRACHP
ncbi:hypothetical protein U5A82_18885 [Sphingobium sp. CR2-8]|uniref:hypothetical protein n=1 Tax=Sphingobium sp. CR2-8 TaxID=1306534 RepID=UPI002DB8AC77|nr:hypothetical protein [Sphingobium sp. CR2-8]MEC3912465.1 hypothetical protein [Sphingobium sp. CR2-8]